MKNEISKTEQPCTIHSVSGSTDYINKNYENQIKKCFKKCLKLVNLKLSIEHRRLEFSAIFGARHRELFYKNNIEIESDNVDWSSYDGNIILYYRPFKMVTYTEKHFYVRKLIEILT